MFIKQKIKKCIIILILMIIFTLSLVFYNKLNPLIVDMFADEFNIVSNKDNLLVHFIDVDQADAVAVNLPDGKILLIDNGSKEVNSTYISYIKENVVHTKTHNYIDYLVLSHSDMDHIGGTMKLLKNFKIGELFMPKLPSDSNGYAEILNYIDGRIDYQTLGKEFVIETEDYCINFLEILNNSNTNDSSQVVKLECNGRSFLFVGDISSSVEKLYVEMYDDFLSADVLKVSHHGSKTASSVDFLTCVSPKYAVISVGATNDYGHPSVETLERLNNVNAEIVRTDKNGDVLFVVGENYNLKQMAGRYYITDMALDYSYAILIFDAGMVLCIMFIVFKKEKLKNKHTSGELLV